MGAKKAITLRLDAGEYEQLTAEARRLALSRATLARHYVWAGLAGTDAAPADDGRRAGLAALRDLALLRRRLPDGDPIDVVALIGEGRRDLDARMAQE